MKEIDIIKYIKIVFSDKKALFTSILSAGLIGIVVALNTPKSYTSSVVLAPELSSSMSMSGGISDIASMVGIDLGSASGGMDAIYPQIYPEIFASNDFVLSLFNLKVRTLEDNTEKTYFNHLTEDQKIPFWSYPGIWISSLLSTEENSKKEPLNPFKLTKKETGVCNEIKKNISCFLEKETSVITISVTDIDPQVAAIMADTVQNRLQAYILAYRTKKARNDLEFAENFLHESKAKYEKARQKYASFSDSNSDLLLQSYKLTQEDLENDMQLKYNVYSQAEQQVNTARLKLQERTPAFTIIQNSTVPILASSTPRILIVAFFIFIGILFDSFWVLYLKKLLANKL